MGGICNDRCKLEFYKESVRGHVRDYIISFNDNETTIEEVIEDSYDLFKKLMETFKNKLVKVRLIAKIEFAAIRDGKEMEIDIIISHLIKQNMLKILRNFSKDIC